MDLDEVGREGEREKVTLRSTSSVGKNRNIGWHSFSFPSEQSFRRGLSLCGRAWGLVNSRWSLGYRPSDRTPVHPLNGVSIQLLLPCFSRTPSEQGYSLL
ncbi:hypothetical protein VNO77_02487 [Canavalia gladiata]|uniref:Uncharacterized protein n=1 Tax=Canavalia gladiata TaxID=3824 RepID=A0AAN9MT16_CANGL